MNEVHLNRLDGWKNWIKT